MIYNVIEHHNAHLEHGHKTMPIEKNKLLFILKILTPSRHNTLTNKFSNTLIRFTN